MKALLCIVIALMLRGEAFASSGDDDILSKVISIPVPSAYRVDGLPGKPPVRRDTAVQGGRALRVDVPGKAPNPSAIAVTVPINKPVKAGDNLVLAIWARLEKGENGATSGTLAHNSIQLTRAPHTTLFSGPVKIGPEWQLQQIYGISNENYAAGDLNVSIYLATAKQVVDIGPVFVLDMGH